MRPVTFYRIDAGHKATFRLRNKVLHRTFGIFADNCRECRVGLHTLVCDHQVKPHDVARIERIRGRYTVHHGIVHADTYDIRETDFACLVGCFGA